MFSFTKEMANAVVAAHLHYELQLLPFEELA